MPDDLKTIYELANILRCNGWTVQPPGPDIVPVGPICWPESDYGPAPADSEPAWRLPMSPRAHGYLAQFYHNRFSEPYPFDRRSSRYIRGDISVRELAIDFMTDPIAFHAPGRFGANSLKLLEAALRQTGYLGGWSNPINLNKLRW